MIRQERKAKRAELKALSTNQLVALCVSRSVDLDLDFLAEWHADALQRQITARPLDWHIRTNAISLLLFG